MEEEEHSQGVLGGRDPGGGSAGPTPEKHGKQEREGTDLDAPFNLALMTVTRHHEKEEAAAKAEEDHSLGRRRVSALAPSLPPVLLLFLFCTTRITPAFQVSFDH